MLYISDSLKMRVEKIKARVRSASESKIQENYVYVVRACLVRILLQYQPMSWGNFPNYYLQNLVTDQVPHSL